MSGRWPAVPRALIAAAAVVAGATVALADPPPLTVTADLAPLSVSDAGQPIMTVGTPFRLVIEARHAPGAIAVLPQSLALGDALGERTDARRLLRRQEGDAEIDRYELDLVPFESGTLTVPEIPLAFGSTTTHTRALEVEIESSLDETTAPVAASTLAEALAELERLSAGNPAPRTIEVPDHRPLWVAGALVALALLALVVSRWKRRTPDALPGPPPPPPRPAHEVALERLQVLMRRAREGTEAQKAYYVDLSEIVRGYLGGRYGFDSVELTIPELFAALDALKTPGLDRRELRRLLDTADLVKFAKLATDDAEAVGFGLQAVAMVESTRPRLEVSAAAPAAPAAPAAATPAPPAAAPPSSTAPGAGPPDGGTS